MAQPILKFRCYRCNKLLGVSPSKAGRTTSCPSCQADLIVPGPEPAAAEEEALPPLVTVTEPVDLTRSRPGPRVSPELGFSWEDVDTALFAADAPPVVLPAPLDEPSPRGGDSERESKIPPIAVEVEIPTIRPERTAPARRSGDVVLSQAVLASWSLFMLLALAIAFVAGLFVGHYAWTR